LAHLNLGRLELLCFFGLFLFMAYVYQHIRLDTNKVFYIGISNDLNYKRSISKNDRNILWQRIVKKYGFKTEILFDNISWEDACKKEMELIKFYGRKDLKEGSLVNLTNGGEGIPGFKHSKESILKTINSEGYKNRKNSKDHIKDKTYEEIHGKKKAAEIKKKQSEAIRPPARTGEDHHLFGKKRPDHSAKLKGKPNYKLRGRSHPHTNESKQKLSIAKTGVPRNKLTCPHCGKIGGDGNMQRWHFNNCKTLHN